MERERLIIETPTTQVRLLAEECLSDGNIHTRKDIVNYVKKQGEIFNLPKFGDGHINSGINQAIKKTKCEVLSRGTFQLKQYDNEKFTDLTCEQRIIDILNNAKLELRNVSKEIDYINANDNELNLLTMIKKCTEIIDNFKKEFDAR